MNTIEARWPRWCVLQAILLIVVCASASAQDEVTQYSRGWYIGMQKEAAKQLEMLSIAYELDSGQQELLVGELDLRIKDQWALIQNTAPIEFENGDMTEDEAKAALLKINQFFEGMPMNPDRIADWVEGVLSQGQAPLGRTRFTELRHRDLQVASIKADDIEDRVRIGREMRMNRSRSAAGMNDEGQWLPVGVRVQPKHHATDGRWRVCQFFRRDSSTAEDSAAARRPAAPNVYPLPCFRDWRDAAERICKRARLHQPAAVSEVWAEFTNRAWRRIALDSVTFNEIQNLDSDRQVAEILVSRGFQADLDALFQELCIRLEAIEAESAPLGNSAISAIGG